MDFHTFKIFKPFKELGCFVFTRHGGGSNPPFNSLNVRFGIGDNKENVEKNRKIITDFIGIKSENLTSLNQVHGDKILKANKPANNEINGCDAIITNTRGLFLMIQVADCQAVCIYDPVNNAIANIHNGWKGSAKNIAGKTVKKMNKEYGSLPKNLLVGISPSIGPCHSKFSDPYNELPNQLHEYIDQNNHVDFWKATKKQLMEEGVKEENIENPEICTLCNKNRYFSYRGGNKKTGRFGVVIGMYV